MKIYGTYQRLCFSGWIFAGLVVLVVNGFLWFSLESQPLSAISPAMKTMASKLSQLDELLAQKVDVYTNQADPDDLMARFSPRTGITPSPVSTSQDRPTDSQPKVSEEIVLPVLAGIVQVRDPRGRLSHKALMNGKMYLVQDRVDNYTVKQITDSGVVLVRGGKRWFIDSPKPPFSKDSGE